jgi:putative pyruvate formate lyase activating enzyme
MINKTEAYKKIEFEPAYMALHRTGELKIRGEKLWRIMETCRLCPRTCETNRLQGDEGFCGASSKLVIASRQPHFGEEDGLVGRGGSGTIFMTHCSLRCVFCINYDISQEGRGNRSEIGEMAEMMLHLQRIGCHNINIVTPTHYSAHVLLALDMAAGKGLRLPLVYNTCGWERLEILTVLDGIVDVYLPDFKYSDNGMADKYSSGADTYVGITKVALKEMNRQVGVAKPAANCLIYHGLMIRHLVMPNNVSGSQDVMRWIAENLPKDTYVNIMAQYRPMHKALDYPEIARRITREEYLAVVGTARNAGLCNLDIQGEFWLTE